MSDHRVLQQEGGVTKTFVTEDGKHFRCHTQDVTPVIDRVKRISEAQAESSSIGRKHEYLGSIPAVMLDAWLKKHGYERSDIYLNPEVRPRLMAWFLSRDFAKLHNQHITTRNNDRGFYVAGGK